MDYYLSPSVVLSRSYVHYVWDRHKYSIGCDSAAVSFDVSAISRDIRLDTNWYISDDIRHELV